MIKSIKKSFKSFLLSTGYNLTFDRLNPTTNDDFQLYKILEYLGVNTVFDIGSNTGQFASSLRSIGYKGEIISFEPLSDAHKKLLINSYTDPKWQVHSQVAVGDIDGEIEINISANSASSSLVPMLGTHLEAASESRYIGKEKVKLARLDSIAPSYLRGPEKYFIKIDTQGSEWQVLDGATKTLANSQGILCEVSLIPLYEGQHLWLEFIQRLEAEGFTLWALQKGFIDKRNGRALQLNAIFTREYNQ